MTRRTLTGGVFAIAVIAALTIAWLRAPPVAVERVAATTTKPPLPAAAPVAMAHAADPAEPAPPGQAFWTADDYFTFIRDYSPAAYRGDGRAAYFVWNATLKCWGALELMRRDGVRLERDFDLCERLQNEDPFASLPPREGGYTWRYWQERAISAGDPMALMQVAVEDKLSPAEQRAAFDAAARSDDPEVYYALGLWLPAVGVGFKESVAWQLVACERGFDCRMDNPRVGMACLETGFCTSGQTVPEKLRDDIGFSALHGAQARADEILADLDAGRVPKVALK